MATYKHLSLDYRFKIQHLLDNGSSLKAIARELGCSTSTISREVKKHLEFRRKGAVGLTFNDCLHRNSCTHSLICDNPSCKFGMCRFCSNCSSVCKDYTKEICSKLSNPPYVCNGCPERNKCRLEKRIYSARSAYDEYRELLVETRCGVSVSEDDVFMINSIVSPLVRQGQSIHHICEVNKDAIMLC